MFVSALSIVTNPKITKQSTFLQSEEQVLIGKELPHHASRMKHHH